MLKTKLVSGSFLLLWLCSFKNEVKGGRWVKSWDLWSLFCRIPKLLLLPILQEEDQLVDFVDENSSDSKPKVDFPSIETDPVLSEIPEKYATNFEEARAIFLPGQRFLNSSKKDYYIFEEHCVDYVDIQRDLSHMHKGGKIS